MTQAFVKTLDKEIVAQLTATHKSIEQLTAEVQKSNNLLEMISKNIQIAAMVMYNAQIMAAKIQSAKIEHERNSYIKDAQEVFDTFAQTIKGEEDGNQERQADPQGSQA